MRTSVAADLARAAEEAAGSWRGGGADPATAAAVAETLAFLARRAKRSSARDERRECRRDDGTETSRRRLADAATGARSPALVHQGKIGEIIQAKPEQRRRVLEDAAGVAGLHARRHEAELRLKAAETNLTRVEDVIGQLTGQMEGLKKQARQAIRYREVAAKVRKSEAMLFHLRWIGANADVNDAAQNHDLAVREMADECKLAAAPGDDLFSGAGGGSGSFGAGTRSLGGIPCFSGSTFGFRIPRAIPLETFGVCESDANPWPSAAA